MVKAAEAAIEGDPEDRNALRRIGEQTGELEPAAQARARRQAVMQHVWLKCLEPLGRLTGIPKEYFEFKFAADMAEKLADVPVDDLIPPKGSVAGPAIQGLGYTVEEPELREMYLNLLAKASDKRVAKQAHPSFAEVIRQLSAEEAQALRPVLASDNHPIVEIRLKSARTDQPVSNSYTVLATHVLNWYEQTVSDDGQVTRRGVASTERTVYVDNWIRLGLVDVSYTTQVVAPGSYDWAETNLLVSSARTQFDVEEMQRVVIQHGVLRVTAFGHAFFEAVIEASA